MKRYAARFLVTTAGLLVGALLGGLNGMNFFGNYLTRFSMFGLRGYEAGFYVGAIAGGLLFGIFAFYISGLIWRRTPVKN